MYCLSGRAQHLQDTRNELLQISDKLLDGTATDSEVPALKARRLQLTALRAELEKPAAGQGHDQIDHRPMMQPPPQNHAFQSQVAIAMHILTRLLLNS